MHATQFKSYAKDSLMIALLLAAFYFIWLGSYPYFTPDEGRYSEVAREMLASGDFITPRVNGVAFLDKPVLYYWLQAAAMRAFSISEWSIRLFPALYGILGCIAVYLAARRLYGRRTGILSALILATSPLYFGASHYANLDLEVAVLISISLLSFITATEASQRTRFWFFMNAYLFASLACLTKGLIGIAFPVMIIGLWILLLSRWKLLIQMYLPAGIILFAVITVPWFILVQRANPEFLHYFFVTQQVSRFVSAGEFNNKAPLWFYLPVILVGFLPWCAFMLQAIAARIRSLRSAPDLFLLLWVFIIVAFFSIPSSKTASYILPIFPALAILTGKYFADAWEQRPDSVRTGMLAIILLNLLIAVLIFKLPHHWADMPHRFTEALFASGIELAVAAIFIILYRTHLRTAGIFYACFITSALMLLTLSFGAKHLDMNSAKPLAQQLKPMLQPGDTVVNYFKFYQDLPLYLDRTMILVANWEASDIHERDNWVRELWYSMPFQKTDKILLDEPAFWKRWDSKEHVYVFLNVNYFKQFLQHGSNYHLVGRHRDILLMKNWG